MKNMKLTDLKVKSFATSEQPKEVKGGTGYPTKYICTEETITIVYGTCSYPCYDIP